MSISHWSATDTQYLDVWPSGCRVKCSISLCESIALHLYPLRPFHPAPVWHFGFSATNLHLSRVCVCVWGNAPDRATARSVCLFCSRFLQTLHRPFYLFMWWVILKPAPPQGHVRPRSASHAVCQGLGKCRHIAAHSRDRAWSLPFITVATVKICGLLFLNLVQKLP